jgi:hypothetical protein
LLEVLDFQVTVFDGPDQRPPSTVIHNEIDNADCIIVLLGPDLTKTAETSNTEPAPWPYEEAVYALAKGKPLALLVHPGTRVPGMLEGYQTPARFDFGDETSYADNVHNVVKHLLDTKRRLEIPPGDLPYYYARVALRNHVDRRGHLTRDIFHHVVARQPWSVLHHSIDTNPDRSPSAHITFISRDDVELEATMGSSGHNIAIEWGESSQHEQPYLVRIQPPVPAGGHIAYRRRVELENYFPLTGDALRERSAEPGFPKAFYHRGVAYYGMSFEVRAEMEALTMAMTFPASVEIRSSRAVAVVDSVQEINEEETMRIGPGDGLAMTRSEELGDTTIELNVTRPLTGHGYLLLYQPSG